MNSFLSFYYYNKDFSNNEALRIIINMSLKDKIEVHKVYFILMLLEFLYIEFIKIYNL